MTENYNKYTWKHPYDLKDEKPTAFYFQEQLSKISKSDYILPNRFSVNLYGDKCSFEPYEFLSYFENDNELTFYIRLTSENIGTVLNLKNYIKPWYSPFKKKFTAKVNILDASLNSVQNIVYDKCHITRVDYPYFEYSDFGDHVATVKVFLKFKKKTI